MSTNLWTFFILLFVEERSIAVLSTDFRVGSSTRLCALVYSLSLFHMLPPMSILFVFLCSHLYSLFRFPRRLCLCKDLRHYHSCYLERKSCRIADVMC